MPIIGTTIKAITRLELSTDITVIGIYFINPPVVPGQNNSGTKTAIVVKVDAMMGNDILEAALMYASAKPIPS